jgi:hypothetical protein
MKIQIFATILMLLITTFASVNLLTESESLENTNTEQVVLETIWDNHSYQFWNVHPMSIGNLSTVDFNSSGDVNITIELLGFFHDAGIWDRGQVNYTIIVDNKSIFSKSIISNKTIQHIDIKNISSPINIIIYSTGSDNESTPIPGDFFIAKTKLVLTE